MLSLFKNIPGTRKIVIGSSPLVSIIVLSALALMDLPLSGQASVVSKTFTVATVRRTAPAANTDGFDLRVTKMLGGPDSETPDRLTYANVTLMDVLENAYDLSVDRISGPDWLRTDRFDISAIIPSGATKSDLQEMLRGLLEERFKLSAHREDRPMAHLTLLVAKTGPKIKAIDASSSTIPHTNTSTNANSSTSAETTLELSVKDLSAAAQKNSCPDMLSGRQGISAITFNGHMCIVARGESMLSLSKALATQTACPVTDMTGLEGAFDFTLVYEPLNGTATGESVPEIAFPATSDPDYPSVFSALTQQLGLRLVRSRSPVAVLIIDHLDKTPTDN